MTSTKTKECDESTTRIANELKLGRSDAERVHYIMLEAYIFPAGSVLSKSEEHAIMRTANYLGFRWVLEFFYRGCNVVIGEHWDGKKEILDIVPQPIH